MTGDGFRQAPPAVSRMVAAVAAVGLMASLPLRWADLHARYLSDDDRWWYTGVNLHSRLGLLGALLSGIIGATGLAAFVAVVVGDARPAQSPRSASVAAACGAIAAAAVALAAVCLRLAGPPPGWVDPDVRFMFGIVLAAVSATALLAGSLFSRYRDGQRGSAEANRRPAR